jgi:hypothetical protein
MKKFHAVCACLLWLSGIALAQAAKPAEPQTVSQVLDRSVTNVENEFVPAADAMPEDKYSFAPTAGEFKGVRRFEQQVKHVAQSTTYWPPPFWGRSRPWTLAERTVQTRSRARLTSSNT